MSAIRRVLNRRTLAYAALATGAGAGGGYYYLNSGPAYPPSTLQSRRPPPPWTPPSREAMLEQLRASALDPNAEFDLLIVGGGATGAGVAVDAATRGLRVALVERDDFSAGTSSKSTKLVHGGVRYLQKAVLELDYEQYKLVREALHERRIFLHTAPYLSHMLPIMLPIYKYWQVPYYWMGCKMYDVLAGKENMESSYVMSKGKALETFPMLKSNGLVGAIVYYDGQHNDSRMNVALIMTAVKHGAIVANHCEVTDLHKNSEGKLDGARVKDALTGKEWNVKAKGIINATGPFSDTLLTLDNPAHKPVVQPSAGIHITLPNYYAPRTMGLLDPATSDGRVIFFLPWQGNTIAGTTDSPAPLEAAPRAGEDDIRWVLEEVRRYLAPDITVRRGDVLSAWSGLRPLVSDPAAQGGTAGLVRNHVVHLSPGGLLTIAGGKWTTYRAMAEETVDAAVKAFGLESRVKNGCVTEDVRLVGSDAWSRNMFIGLIQRFGLETDVAKYLSDNYGDRAWTVCSLSHPTGEAWPLHGIRLNRNYPYIEAEVRYAVRHEYAQTAVDVLARRTRLAFLNSRTALAAAPRVVDIMASELGWSRARRAAELRAVHTFLCSMGIPADAPLPALLPRGALEHAWDGAWRLGTGALALVGLGTGGGAWARGPGVMYSRARYDAGEVEALRELFARHAHVAPEAAGGAASDEKATAAAATAVEEQEKVIRKEELRDVLGGFPGYEGIPPADYEYVLEEAGFAQRRDLDLDEFIEICGSLKEVAFAPPVSNKVERKRIPVEKSGGGV
ncbi:DAO-domain-containing protein [Coniophora puteana RWD-64-598 SS2]|uniref:Glycerol-3-phosphate dehydrogenase n=1 Tax=Coniophora puteana (strain RWD-64-598) TaxID=741705 RepID=A0A5M3MPR4_CONPW|nr:DAO-domain-containing protein [Coniophora puteana RWD-64-598 SS2]EIW81182.1 DAO-domain-containing protein [Coniophora puteana RWD-64-598 SS2]